ncbi:MAG: redoxin domain-containing protein [Deltaproteobacteria bacterium]|nr:redoxin domain-containing protein [Deltaproteobacteria bacterium]
MQGNGFRDRIREFEDKNVTVLGISFDTVEENKAFAEKFDYTFLLLSDVDRKVGLALGACDAPDAGWAARISYVIDEKGIVVASLADVDPTTHTDDVLKLLAD